MAPKRGRKNRARKTIPRVENTTSSEMADSINRISERDSVSTLNKSITLICMRQKQLKWRNKKHYNINNNGEVCAIGCKIISLLE